MRICEAIRNIPGGILRTGCSCADIVSFCQNEGDRSYMLLNRAVYTSDGSSLIRRRNDDKWSVESRSRSTNTGRQLAAIGRYCPILEGRYCGLIRSVALLRYHVITLL